ncbi:hypothetical protein IFM89_034668 [Coptis chinensis]|uniref:BED-type domain-containing protein n=1 Tax=Coptis chinensis TaxID=261450 RepID=A0A835HRL6_9MAGN|nr:hypothetical protein IFM89_034668 [Coptis chinensis]
MEGIPLMGSDPDSDVDMVVGNPPVVTPRIPRKTSHVWKQFDKVTEKNDDGTIMKQPNGKDVMKAVCKICSEKLVFGGRSGTSHLSRHATSCLKRTTSDVGQTIIGRTPTGGIYSFTFSQVRARRETVRYFIREELPFNKVEKPAFRRWIQKSFGPQFKPPGRLTLRADIFLILEEEKAVLKDLLRSVPGKICLTSDLWTSNQKLGYMCITAHFICTDWKLHKRVISFPMLPCPHTGKIISDAIYANLLGWNISDKIGTLTLDNASNNDVCVSRLKDQLFGHDMLSRELFHLRCNAHITNLLVKDGLKHVESSLENIRESVRHVKYSPSKLQKFFETCQSLNMKEKRLPIDIQTRWNSTYLMLEATIPYQKVFDLFFYDSDFAYKPDLVDWQNAIVIKEFFEIFYVSTKSFSCSNSVTSSTFFFQLSKIVLILKRVENVPSFKPLYDSIKWKYDKYWKDVPMLLGLASCMDPCFKFTALELCLDFNYDYDSQSQPESQSPSVSNENPWLLPYKTKLNELFEVYLQKMSSGVTGMNETSSNAPQEEDMVLAMLSKRREAAIKKCKSELQRYAYDWGALITGKMDVIG